MRITEEIKLGNRPSYNYEDIVRVNLINIDRITVRKVDFPTFSMFEIRCMTETGEKPLRICINST